MPRRNSNVRDKNQSRAEAQARRKTKKKKATKEVPNVSKTS